MSADTPKSRRKDILKKAFYPATYATLMDVNGPGKWCQKNTPIGTQVADFLRELAVGNHQHHQ
jgi:hypothetical protein